MWNTERGNSIIREYNDGLRFMRDAGRISRDEWKRLKTRLLAARTVEECNGVWKDAQKGNDNA